VDRLLSNVLPDFLARYPRLRLQLIVTKPSGRSDQRGGRRGPCACARNSTLTRDAGAHPRPFLHLAGGEPRVPHGHGAPAGPDELGRFATIGLTDVPGPARWTLVDDSGREATATVEPRLSASTFPPLRQAALDGLGIALLPHYLGREGLEDGRLVRVLPDWSGPDGILHLVFTSRRGLLPGVRAAIDLIARCWARPRRRWGQSL